MGRNYIKIGGEIMKIKKEDRWMDIAKGLLVIVLIFPLLGELFTSKESKLLNPLGMYIKANKDYYATAFTLLAALLIPKRSDNTAGRD